MKGADQVRVVSGLELPMKRSQFVWEVLCYTTLISVIQREDAFMPTPNRLEHMRMHVCMRAEGGWFGQHAARGARNDR